MGFNHVSVQHFMQEMEIFSAVYVVVKNQLAIISTGRHVIEFTSCTETQRMGHCFYIIPIIFYKIKQGQAPA